MISVTFKKGGASSNTEKMKRHGCVWMMMTGPIWFAHFHFLRKPHVQRPMNASLSSVKYLFFLSVRIKERQGRNLYRNIKYHFNELFCEWEKRTFEMQKSEKEKTRKDFVKKEKKSTFGMIKGFMRTKRCWWPDELPVFFFQLRCFEFFFLAITFTR